MPGDELDDKTCSARDAAALAAAGFAAHQVGDWTQRFVADGLEGLPVVDGQERGELAMNPEGQPVRAGMVKAGVGYWRISAFERRALAAAETAARTGVAAMVHLEYGSAAHEVPAQLASDGLGSERVVLAHIDRNLDPGLHAELAAAGAFLGFDGPARHREAPDSAIIATMVELIERGHGDRILLGRDVARRSRYRGYGGIPGLEYLPTRFSPRLRERIGGAATRAILLSNPRTLLGLRSIV